MANVDSVSSTGSSSGASVYQSNQQVATDFKTLADALKSGDLSSAQSAYATLQKDAPGLFSSSNSQASTQSNPLDALGTALKNGDLSGAQSALAALQKGHRGHHHHRAEASSSSATDASASASTATSSATSTTGNLLNVKI